MGTERLRKESQDKFLGSLPLGVRIVQPRTPGIGARIAAKLCDGIEALLVQLFSGASSKSNLFLQENFAPVGESGPFADLPVTGALPECLNGEFVRTGPNPRFEPTAGYHWFDGDGMLHGLRIKDGKANYVSRYVKTSKLKQEEFYGTPTFLKVGDLKGILGIFLANVFRLRVALGVVDAEYGMGTANTAMVYHNKKLLALLEADKPYAIRMLEDGNLETIGVLDYDKRLSHAVTAHPKVDPVTGEMFFFCYQQQTPYVIYRVISKDGTLHDPVSINIPDPVMMHDFAITENYAIFMDLPMTFKPKNMGEGKMIISFDSTKRSRFGVLPRYALSDSQMRWFHLPSCYIFHTANAWEDGDEVVLVACRMPKFDMELMKDTDDHVLELYEFRFNMKSGAALQRPLSKGPAVEFPRINENYIGRKQRYVYAAVFHDQVRIKGVAKFDLHKDPELSKDGGNPVGSNVVGEFMYGGRRFGSEAVFVPKSSDKDADEDDGYLISFVYDEGAGKSEAVVIDAKTMAADPVAVVSIPVRIPYGFHSIFVNEDQLENQA
ncbi:carotenoid 9,10(9',10')-cleavage dioxygenase 1 isoform X2 [Selaginella moellendorffii]|uniref:carotenoid 9,10(9',10')-cleavage dioxygenase 1 isoform X2 n=1 Tax=Selaginella moellendorffii TaxID=88036 RepID=UPI000D1C25DD|nr:carotenoid 9,10(9',10')-cleavage dioxygenase 1 isoform X2 [Selaginella moellendorffii]|eukprot:XP_024518892.1 carotenoid 9,10(9',10')-cleavage dioxygenase 1 isoform X2 [Selaginella moellendorffii]